MIGLLLSFLVAIFKSSSSILAKQLLDGDINSYVSSWAVRFFAVPILLLVVVLFDAYETPTTEFYVYLLISAAGGVIGTLSYMKALEVGDISFVDPLSAISPILLLVTTPIIVAEFPSAIGFVGVVIIVIGVYLIEVNVDKYDTLAGPLKTAMREEQATKYIAVLLFFYSITAPVDKLAAEAGDPIMYSLFLNGVQSIILFGIMIVMVDEWRRYVASKDTVKLSFVGIFSGIASMFQMIAITYTLVIYVLSIKRMGVVISTIWGIIIRNERGGFYRVIGAILISIGAVLISIAL